MSSLISTIDSNAPRSPRSAQAACISCKVLRLHGFGSAEGERFDTCISYTYTMCMQEAASKRAGRMVRKQLLLEAAQNSRLKALATALSRPESELVREALDEWLARQTADREDWKAAWLQAAGMWENRDDLDELVPSLRSSWDRTVGNRTLGASRPRVRIRPKP